MTVDELRKLLEPLDGDEDIKIVIDEESDPDCGDIHMIRDIGFQPRVGHVIYSQEG